MWKQSCPCPLHYVHEALVRNTSCYIATSKIRSRNVSDKPRKEKLRRRMTLTSSLNERWDIGWWWGGGGGRYNIPLPSTLLSTATWVFTSQKPNSWTNNCIEVYGHNLESSQAWGFRMDFLNDREGGMVFLLSPLQKLLEVAWVWRNRNLNAKL
jgi:hypothetical protein